jgi:flavin reductase (DIM6/NTAB) family NADH-FMN oxidoreductase RutF
MGSAEETFKRLVAQLDYPTFIATVATDGERAGCLIGFATQCSIHPPRFLAGLSDKNRTYRVARGAGSMAVHLGPEGVPLLDGCPNRFVGRIVERIEFGDHLGMVLEPFFAEKDERSGQLGFHRARRIDPGHEA